MSGTPEREEVDSTELAYLRGTVEKLGLWFDSLGPNVIAAFKECPGDWGLLLQAWTRWDHLKTFPAPNHNAAQLTEITKIRDAEATRGTV